MSYRTIRSVALYGYGYVGKSFYDYIKNHATVEIYDPGLQKKKDIKKLATCDAAVVCVPTPTAEDGSCDISIVESVVAEISQRHILIKSTVSPGTTEYLAKKYNKDIVFSPEFISESTYMNPFYQSIAQTPFIIVGGEPSARDPWLELFEQISGPTTTYYQCSGTEAELIKYTANAYSALKVTFANEIYEIAKHHGADWRTVREGWLLDKRVEPMSTLVFPNKRGYNGKCLPKDVFALSKASQKAGYKAKLIEQVHASNLRFAAERLDEHFIHIAVKDASNKATPSLEKIEQSTEIVSPLYKLRPFTTQS